MSKFTNGQIGKGSLYPKSKDGSILNIVDKGDDKIWGFRAEIDVRPGIGNNYETNFGLKGSLVLASGLPEKFMNFYLKAKRSSERVESLGVPKEENIDFCLIKETAIALRDALLAAYPKESQYTIENNTDSIVITLNK
jgi:hypothetical protein